MAISSSLSLDSLEEEGVLAWRAFPAAFFMPVCFRDRGTERGGRVNGWVPSPILLCLRPDAGISRLSQQANEVNLLIPTRTKHCVHGGPLQWRHYIGQWWALKCSLWNIQHRVKHGRCRWQAWLSAHMRALPPFFLADRSLIFFHDHSLSS